MSAAAADAQPDPDRGSAITIVGGGVSGSLLAIHLLRRARPPFTVTLIERRPALGRGHAYSTTNPAHLLNVRAANMSAFEDEPDHFLHWLAGRSGGEADSYRAAFVPRSLYGAYVAECLSEAEARAPDGVALARVQGEAVAAGESADGVVARLSDESRVHADRLALCLGNFPPAVPRGLAALVSLQGYLDDPWDWPAFEAIGSDDPVLILGTGLTMVDVLLELEVRGHRGPVLALSRHGLLSRVHAASRPKPSLDPNDPAPRRARSLLRQVRAACRDAEATGDGWRSAIDGLRPQTKALWQAMSPAEQKRFVRHVQPWWDVHRHRLAPEVAEQIERLRAGGRLTIAGGRLTGVDQRGEAIEARWCVRSCTEPQVFEARWIVNCTGPLCDYSRIRDPLVRHLLALGHARPDPLHLGLDVAGDGAVRRQSGVPSRRVFALGPPTRGAFWEITAVPDIRKAAEALALRLLTLQRLPRTVRPSTRTVPGAFEAAGI